MAKDRPRIIVLGSLNVDIVSYVARHPLPGETITSEQLIISPGGKGANQAAACAKLSRTSNLLNAVADIDMIGAVGSDPYGTLVLDGVRSYGVNTDLISVHRGDETASRTGLAVITVDKESGQNRIVYSPGANYTISPAQLRKASNPRPDLLIMQLEVPLETVLEAMEDAKAAGVPVLLNPAPARPLPAEVYNGLAHLVVNETEAALLSGCAEEDLAEFSGLQQIGALFLERGVENVVITLGGRGVYYANTAGKSALVPALKIKVLDTTAAGDTFIGSYALSLVGTGPHEEFDIHGAIRSANKASSITVARKGAQISIPWRDELL